MKILIAFILTTGLAAAQDVKVVKKGELVPYDGVLFPKEKEREIRTELETFEKKIITLRKLNDLNEKEIDILQKRVELYHKKSVELADREVKQESNSFVKSAIYFVSGALLTGVIGYGVIQAYR